MLSIWNCFHKHEWKPYNESEQPYIHGLFISSSGCHNTGREWTVASAGCIERSGIARLRGWHRVSQASHQGVRVVGISFWQLRTTATHAIHSTAVSHVLQQATLYNLRASNIRQKSIRFFFQRLRSSKDFWVANWPDRKQHLPGWSTSPESEVGTLLCYKSPWMRTHPREAKM